MPGAISRASAEEEVLRFYGGRLTSNELEEVAGAVETVTESVVGTISDFAETTTEVVVSATTDFVTRTAESVTETTTEVVGTTSEGITTIFVPVTEATTIMSPNNLTEDPAKAVQEEILKKVNEMVDRLNAKGKTEEEKGPLFGEVERHLQSTVESVTENIRNASAGEVIVLVIGILTFLYTLDKIVKWGFRHLIRKNYEGLYYQPGDDEGRSWRIFWRGLENILERVWIPLWCTGASIRREELLRLTEEDLESVRVRVRAPDNTMVHPPRRGQPATVNHQGRRSPPRPFSVYQPEQEQRLVRTHRMITRTPRNIEDNEEEERRR